MIGNFCGMEEQALKKEVAAVIRCFPDFPTKGVLFRLTLSIIFTILYLYFPEISS